MVGELPSSPFSVLSSQFYVFSSSFFVLRKGNCGAAPKTIELDMFNEELRTRNDELPKSYTSVWDSSYNW
jgi:hypothetical protein